MKIIFLGSHTQHPWRYSKDFDLDFRLTKTKSGEKMCILKVLQGFSLCIQKHIPTWKIHQLKRSFTICKQTFHHSKAKRPFCTFSWPALVSAPVGCSVHWMGFFFIQFLIFWSWPLIFLFLFLSCFFFSSDLTYPVIRSSCFFFSQLFFFFLFSCFMNQDNLEEKKRKRTWGTLHGR